jgi:hypothetical protein
VSLQLKSSEHAAGQINEARANAAARPNSAHAAHWRALEKLLREVISNEDHAFSSATALGRRRDSNLPGVRRAKIGERGRVFFLASREKKLAIVLMIGFRKDGDRNDAYLEIARRIRRGEFDEQFREAGIDKPNV